VAIGGALSSGINYAATETVNGREVELGTLAIEATVGAAFNLISFGAAGGSTQKVVGGLMNNLKKNTISQVMENTTRKVAGKVVYKSTYGVAKNVAKNIGGNIAMGITVSFGQWIFAQCLEVFV
jgi:hypothetical protein